MAIVRRVIPAGHELQVPAKTVRVFVPNPDSVMTHLRSDAVKRRAGVVLYQSASPSDTPFDDLVTMARTMNDETTLERAYRNRIKGRLSAIRAWCVLSQGSAKRVRSCENVTCPLYPFRMGTNPFRRRK